MADALQVARVRALAIRFVRKRTFDSLLEHRQLLAQWWSPGFRKRAREVLEHRAQPARHLDAVRPEKAHLTGLQCDEVFPSRSRVQEAHFPGVVCPAAARELPAAEMEEVAVELVDRQHRRGGIVDRRRK